MLRISWWACSIPMVSYCCGKPPIPDTLKLSEYGATGMCNGCREWTTFEPKRPDKDVPGGWPTQVE